MSRNVNYTLVWTDTGVETAVVPDTDSVIDVRDAETLVIQVDTTHASNTSGDIDINVMGSTDNSTYDTVAHAESNFADGKIRPMTVNVEGLQSVKLRLDNNEAATTGYVTARCNVQNE